MKESDVRLKTAVVIQRASCAAGKVTGKMYEHGSEKVQGIDVKDQV